MKLSHGRIKQHHGRRDQDALCRAKFSNNDIISVNELATAVVAMGEKEEDEDKKKKKKKKKKKASDSGSLSGSVKIAALLEHLKRIRRRSNA